MNIAINRNELSVYNLRFLTFLAGFRGEDFLEINQSKTRMACGGHVC
jgi:hypothetical protein